MYRSGGNGDGGGEVTRKANAVGSGSSLVGNNPDDLSALSFAVEVVHFNVACLTRGLVSQQRGEDEGGRKSIRRWPI